MTKRKVEPQLHLIGGAVSGLAACVLLQPLDLVKTRLQQELQHRQSLLLNPLKLHNSGLLKDLTIWSTARDVIKQDSIRGLWRGTWPTVLRNVPGSALYFFTLDEMRRGLHRWARPGGSNVLSDGAINLMGGAGARVAVGFVMMPITVIKVRYESNFYNYASIMGATKSIMKEEGVRGLFRGFGATAMRDAPYAGVYLWFYENFKAILSGFAGGSNPVLLPAVHMTSGVVSGVAAAIVTNPFDVIKTRMQLRPLDYRSILQSFWKIVKEERVTGFFAGMLPRLLRKTFSAAITWTIYEEVVRLGRAGLILSSDGEERKM